MGLAGFEPADLRTRCPLDRSGEMPELCLQRVFDGDLLNRSALDNRAVVSKILVSNHGRSHPRC